MQGTPSAVGRRTLWKILQTSVIRLPPVASPVSSLLDRCLTPDQAIGNLSRNSVQSVLPPASEVPSPLRRRNMGSEYFSGTSQDHETRSYPVSLPPPTAPELLVCSPLPQLRLEETINFDGNPKQARANNNYGGAQQTLFPSSTTAQQEVFSSTSSSSSETSSGRARRNNARVMTGEVLVTTGGVTTQQNPNNSALAYEDGTITPATVWDLSFAQSSGSTTPAQTQAEAYAQRMRESEQQQSTGGIRHWMAKIPSFRVRRNEVDSYTRSQIVDQMFNDDVPDEKEDERTCEIPRWLYADCLDPGSNVDDSSEYRVDAPRLLRQRQQAA